MKSGRLKRTVLTLSICFLAIITLDEKASFAFSVYKNGPGEASHDANFRHVQPIPAVTGLEGFIADNHFPRQRVSYDPTPLFSSSLVSSPDVFEE